MNIADLREKSKSYLGHFPKDMLAVCIIILSSLASFGIGYLAGVDVGQGSHFTLEESPLLATSTLGQVFASKNGSRYYAPDCPGADRVSDSNKIWFTSVFAALSAGYTAARGCEGL